jgi:hypothetical protein
MTLDALLDGDDRLVNDLIESAIAADAGLPTSLPLYAVELGPLTLTVIRVSLHGCDTFQTYAISDESWSLVAICGLYVDAVVEIRRWRRYVADGHTLAHWLATHPDGVRPDQSAIVVESAVAR